MDTSLTMPSFSSDYSVGAHPAILEALVRTNEMSLPGYGADVYCDSACRKIRAACACPDAQVHFFMGGTQTNTTVIRALLRPYEGVLAADTAHIASHEGGAIELGGHKVLTLPHTHGKLSAAQIEQFLKAFYRDSNHPHMVHPGMVYLSHPTEYGTLYTRTELRAIRAVCNTYDIPLYLDGARLAYALACPENDVTLPELSNLCDAFYIGGTKCGALFGEALVLPKKDAIAHCFTIMKQQGAVLAKGRLLGLQFDVLFSNNLYKDIGAPAIQVAQEIKAILHEAGIPLYLDTPTNQVFAILPNEGLNALISSVGVSLWEPFGDTQCVARFVTSWASTPEDVQQLRAILLPHTPSFH